MALDMYLGDTLIFDVAFEFQGPKYTTAFIRASIGKREPLIGFQEMVYNHKTISVGPNSTWLVYEWALPIVLKAPLSVDVGFDLECKVGGIPGADLFWKLDNAINILPGVPEAEFRNLAVEIKKG